MRPSLRCVLVCAVASLLSRGAGAADPPVLAAREAVLKALDGVSPKWELVGADAPDRPSAVAGSVRGWRVVLRQTVKVYTSLPQQQKSAPRAEDADWPHVFRHCHLEVVAFDAAAGVRPQDVPWQKDLAQMHSVRAVDLGGGMGFHWFARGEVFWTDWVRAKLGLQGGDDRVAVLVEALAVKDEGSQTANSAAGLLVSIGDAAVPALLAEAKKQDPDVSGRCAGILAGIPGKPAAAALVELYTSGDERLRRLAAYGLVHSSPPRPEGKDQYLDLLKRGPYVAYAARAVGEAGWKEMVPALRAAHDRPESYRAWRDTFDAIRALERAPVWKDLREAADQLKFTEHSQAKPSEEEIARCKQVFLKAIDREAAVVLAVELAMAVTKGDMRRTNAIGREILRELPEGVVKPLLAPLTERMTGESERADVTRRLGF